MADIATLTELIEPEVKSLGFALVRVKLFGGADDRTLQIMAERSETRQLTIDDCAALSRRISELFDEIRSEEHTSELQSLMRISYAVFCLKKKKQHKNKQVTAT